MKNRPANSTCILLVMAALLLPMQTQGQKYTSSLPHPSSPALKSILEQEEKWTQGDGMTQAHFDQTVEAYNLHYKKYPHERQQTLVRLGELYSATTPTTLRNYELAIQYFRDVLATLDPTDSVNRGFVYRRMASIYAKMGEAYRQRIERYLTDATKLNPINASYLAELYLFGWGVYQDFILAEDYFNLAIQAGGESCALLTCLMRYVIEQSAAGTLDHEAFDMTEKGLYYLNLQQDEVTAMQWLSRACMRGFVPAYQIRADVLKIEGHTKEAEACYQLAAEENYPSALVHIALQNKDVKMMQKAAEQGYIPALRILGDWYWKGYAGLTKDPVKAAVWYKLGQKLYNGICTDRLDSLYKAVHFTPAQEEEINTRFESQLQVVAPQIDRFRKQLEADTIFGNPVLRTTVEEGKLAYVHSSNDPSFMSNIAKSYRTAYEVHGGLLKAMSITPGEYWRKNGLKQQTRMKMLRTRAESLGIQSIRKSMWEDWDGR